MVGLVGRERTWGWMIFGFDMGRFTRSLGRFTRSLSLLLPEISQPKNISERITWMIAAGWKRPFSVHD